MPPFEQIREDVGLVHAQHDVGSRPPMRLRERKVAVRGNHVDFLAGRRTGGVGPAVLFWLEARD